MSSGLPWLWTALGWALIALALVQLLPFHRLRKRKSEHACKACAYDMKGLDTLTCPECGHTNDGRKPIARQRRYRRRVVLALVLLPIGWIAMRVPLVLDFGLLAALPDWSLAVLAPVKGSDADLAQLRTAAQAGMQARVRTKAIAQPPVSRSARERLESALYMEMWRRLQTPDVSGSAAAYYLRRVFDPTPERLRKGAFIPTRWPNDTDAPPTTDLAAEFETPILVTRVFDLTPDNGQPALAAHAAGLEIARLPIDVDTTRTSETFMDRVSSDQAATATLAALKPVLTISEHQAWIEFNARTDGPEWEPVQWALYLNVTAWRAGHELAKGTCDFEMRSRKPGTVVAVMQWNDTVQAEVVAHPDEVLLEISGDPVAATDQFVFGRTRMMRAWAGSATAKPVVQRLK